MERLENFKDIHLFEAPGDSEGNKLKGIEDKTKPYPRFRMIYCNISLLVEPNSRLEPIKIILLYIY